MSSATRRLTDAGAAVEVLRSGGTVALPTETVYGLGADASSDAAVQAIFDAKGRPAGHPLIVHVADHDRARSWLEGDDGRVGRLAKRFWPGPLTLVVPRSDRVSMLAVGGRDTVGLRVPDHPLTLDVLDRFDGGVAAPSANRFGHVSPTTADHVVADLDGRIDAVLDGGPCGVGIESTIVEVLPGQPMRLLRPGGLGVEAIAEVVGEEVLDDRAGSSRAAGMMASHYAPSAPVLVVPAGDLDSVRRGDDAIVGAFPGAVARSTAPSEAAWPLPDEAAGFAEGLYRALRAADAVGPARILVVPPTHGPMLDAVLDRLAKAAN